MAEAGPEDRGGSGGTSLKGLGGAKLEPADAPHVSTHYPLGTWRVSGPCVFSAQAQRSPHGAHGEAGLLLQPQTGHEAGSVMEGTARNQSWDSPSSALPNFSPRPSSSEPAQEPRSRGSK